MGGEGSPRTENPRTFLQAVTNLILANRQRQAPDDPIGLRYPIRVYQSGRSSIIPFSIFLIIRFDKREEMPTID
jgi:hypothetical protein